MVKTKYYAVIKGRQTGVFTSWSQCEAQVKGFSGAIYKSFGIKAEAEAALELGRQNNGYLQEEENQQRGKAKRQSTTGFVQSGFVQNSLCVDAACSGNPGIVEYKGVCTATHEVIFYKGPIQHGTNNLGEFLAIVHALIYLQEQGKEIPIYSDSETAMLWVRNRNVKTTLKQNSASKEIFSLLETALDWLKNNDYSNPILKWNTKAWGEIPADFGRK